MKAEEIKVGKTYCGKGRKTRTVETITLSAVRWFCIEGGWGIYDIDSFAKWAKEEVPS